ncbi:MAG TPA: gluconokinase [Pseudolabrys sp.]|nr:gluconokinase [Pseudolabrys sp.]
MTPPHTTRSGTGLSSGGAGDAAAPQPPIVAVVMGVSGSGKTTVAAMLAGRLHWRFEEGDSLHSPENVAKMRSGIPLTDEDREPWLQAIAAVIRAWIAEGQSGVVACSALKRAYRRILIGDNPGVRLIYLKGSRELVHQRLAARQGHFMPVQLLDSQFATLEEPGPDESPIVVPIEHRPDEIVTEIAAALAAR